MFDFIKTIIQSRKLLLDLTKNYLRQKYIDNFLGILWAFIQPIVNILIYWLVFQIGFKSKPINNFPYVIWMISGMVPWFFFAEGLQNGANSIIDNSFLVKKVVFRVSMLPIVPITSALFIHLFFISIMLMMFICYGYTPNLYWLQIFYYTFATFILLLGLSWITSSIIVFFKDLGQIITVMLQFGYWITPIFWLITILPEKYHLLIILNPMYYIVEGYRDSMIYHKWFWEDWHMAIYFWTVTLIIFFSGALIFKKLRPHFADIL